MGIEVGASTAGAGAYLYGIYYLLLTAYSCCGPYMMHIQCAAKSMNNWLAPWVLFLILV